MKKMFFAALLSAAVLSTASAATLRDYAPGKTPQAKNVKFAMSQDGVLSMEFGEGNTKGANAWMRRYHDFITVGKALKGGLAHALPVGALFEQTEALVLNQMLKKTRAVRGGMRGERIAQLGTAFEQIFLQFGVEIAIDFHGITSLCAILRQLYCCGSA